MSRYGDNCTEHDLPYGSCIECVRAELATSAAENAQLREEVERYRKSYLERDAAWLEMFSRVAKADLANTAATLRAERLEKALGDIAEVLDATKELNMSNFDVDDVAQLNNSHIQVYQIVHAVQEVLAAEKGE